MELETILGRPVIHFVKIFLPFPCDLPDGKTTWIQFFFEQAEKDNRFKVVKGPGKINCSFTAWRKPGQCEKSHCTAYLEVGFKNANGETGLLISTERYSQLLNLSSWSKCKIELRDAMNTIFGSYFQSIAKNAQLSDVLASCSLKGADISEILVLHRDGNRIRSTALHEPRYSSQQRSLNGSCVSCYFNIFQQKPNPFEFPEVAIQFRILKPLEVESLSAGNPLARLAFGEKSLLKQMKNKHSMLFLNAFLGGTSADSIKRLVDEVGLQAVFDWWHSNQMDIWRPVQIWNCITSISVDGLVTEKSDNYFEYDEFDSFGEDYLESIEDDDELDSVVESLDD